MKTLLVTGHRGLLGSAIARKAAHNGYQVLTANGTDLRDEYSTRVWFLHNKPNFVINCAAKVGGVKANRDFPVDFLNDNIKIQSSVIRACAECGVEKLVSIGTSCLFPKDAPVPVCEDSLLTGPFEQSVQAYAIAKLAGHALSKAYHDQYGKNFMTACPSNIYGKGDNYGETAHVIPALMRKIKASIDTGAPLKVWGNGTAIREFIYADDAADAILTVLEKWNKPDAINVGTGIGLSIARLVNAMISIIGAKLDVEWDNSQPTGIQNKTFNIDKLTSLGWSPKIGIMEGLAETWSDFINDKNPRLNER